MRIFVKILLVIGVCLFSLINLRVYSFNKGFSKTEYPENKTIVETIKTIANLKKVEYYKLSFNDDEYIYNVYIETNEDCYLLRAKQEDIDAFSTLGILIDSFKPEKISPIPIYVDVAIMLAILAIPLGKRS